MEHNWKVFVLLGAILALQRSTFAHPLEESSEIEATPPSRGKTIKISELNTTGSIIPNTPGVQRFKSDLIGHLLPLLSDGNEDAEDVYEAKLNSSEIDLPCTTDRVTIHVISSSFPLPERFFHAPKRCSEEET